MFLEWSKCITFIVHFISITVVTAPSQIVRYLILEAEDPLDYVRIYEFYSELHGKSLEVLEQRSDMI